MATTQLVSLLRPHQNSQQQLFVYVTIVTEIFMIIVYTLVILKYYNNML